MKDCLKSALICETGIMGSLVARLGRVEGSLEYRANALANDLKEGIVDVDSLKKNVYWLRRYKKRVEEVANDLDCMIEQIEEIIKEM